MLPSSGWTKNDQWDHAKVNVVTNKMKVILIGNCKEF